ncbi:hypothetical protein J1N51_12995 [Psychrosphaera ytuae]|uniref:DUF5666 domain-containing protein n=1 Tax=Psychrosphaera ytuae TaxID=2820710 RepID=A0A975DBC0_9GAMM|nr:hypothetical protein [Psychrosphaera ytuae]QTH63624.1 hypothetical protein J1N51_12995 [Psychrosphaera ytuae]
MKTQLLSVVLITLVSLFFTNTSLAHGDPTPKHGGVVKVEHEMMFELVRDDAGTSLYLRDHGKPYPTEKLTGSVTVLASGKKVEADLQPAGENKMTANVKIEDGAKVLVKVKEDGHHSVTVRFSF